MIILTWISALLLIQTSQSYVLLTANLDDVQNLLHQVLQSPAAEKMGQYVRRATTLFNQHMRSHGDDKDLKESPLVRQVVNVLRSAYNALKEQFTKGDKDTETKVLRKKKEQSSLEFSAEMDDTRRRARHHIHHSRHKHSRKHYPVPHRSRRAGAADAEADKEVNTISENKGDVAAKGSKERRERLKDTNEMVALGKNASLYLSTIKEIIEKSTI